MTGEKTEKPDDSQHTISKVDAVAFYNGQAAELEGDQRELCAEMAMSTGDNLTTAEKRAMARLEGRLYEVQALHAFLHSQNADHELREISPIQFDTE